MSLAFKLHIKEKRHIEWSTISIESGQGLLKAEYTKKECQTHSLYYDRYLTQWECTGQVLLPFEYRVGNEIQRCYLLWELKRV